MQLHPPRYPVASCPSAETIHLLPQTATHHAVRTLQQAITSRCLRGCTSTAPPVLITLDNTPTWLSPSPFADSLDHYLRSPLKQLRLSTHLILNTLHSSTQLIQSHHLSLADSPCRPTSCTVVIGPGDTTSIHGLSSGAGGAASTATGASLAGSDVCTNLIKSPAATTTYTVANICKPKNCTSRKEYCKCPSS